MRWGKMKFSTHTHMNSQQGNVWQSIFRLLFDDFSSSRLIQFVCWTWTISIALLRLKWDVCTSRCAVRWMKFHSLQFVSVLFVSSRLAILLLLCYGNQLRRLSDTEKRWNLIIYIPSFNIAIFFYFRYHLWVSHLSWD